ncbi:MAG: hypothetical protein M1837_005042 [Sclerophora amabilis]|nr:MAG: hypothetical protein M1837_005042 [Sclerophora amabilis]
MNGETPRSHHWWPRSKKSKELDEALEGEKDFQNWLRQNIDKSDVKAIDEKAPANKVLDSLQNQTLEDLTELVEPYYAADKLAEAGRAKSELRKLRLKGPRKVTTAFAKFALTFVDFLKVYSGIVDIMVCLGLEQSNHGCKLIDRYQENRERPIRWSGVWSIITALQRKPRYRISTKSVLLNWEKVAASRQKLELSLQSAIENLKIRLEEMAIYKRVYPDPSLGALIAKVYKGITNFSRVAIKYYKNHGVLRLLHAAGDPYNFDESVDEIRVTMGCVQSRCEALLAERCERLEKKSNGKTTNPCDEIRADYPKDIQQRLMQVQGQNDELQNTVNKLKEQLSRMDETKDSEKLTELLRHLDYRCIDDNERYQQVSACKTYLQDFANDPLRTKMDLKTLQDSEQYSHWTDCNHSCLLALSGRNEQNAIERSGWSCWLSAAAVDLVDELRNRGELLVYHFCLLHPFQTTSPTAHDILTSVAGQLLTERPNVLRDAANFTRLRAHLQDPDWAEEIDGICDFIISTLNLIREESERDRPIYLVLDRIDRCSGATIEAEFMNALLKVIKGAQCNLKILVVVCANYWDMTRDSKSMDTKKLDQGMFVQLIRDQELCDVY